MRCRFYSYIDGEKVFTGVTEVNITLFNYSINLFLLFFFNKSIFYKVEGFFF